MTLSSALADELLKVAMMNVPVIPTTAIGNAVSAIGSAAKSGAGVKIGKTALPSVPRPRTLRKGSSTSAVPGASPSNMLSNFSPRPKTVPPVAGGTSMVR